MQYYVTHELGHAIGLRDAGALVASGSWSATDDSQSFSIMSYKLSAPLRRSVTEYQLYDIASMQAIYGRTDATNAGDTVHNQFGENYLGALRDRAYSIWDGSGTDVISASSYIKAAYIDLRPGYFSSIGPDSTFSLTIGTDGTAKIGDLGALNISIAYGAYIENATGGPGNDLLIGNLLSNNLAGGEGDDAIYAEGVNALNDPGAGDYRRVSATAAGKIESAPSDILSYVNDPTKQSDTLDGGGGNDLLVGGRGADFLYGGGGRDKLLGGDGADLLDGGDGNDLLIGGVGADILRGGAGNDVLVLDNEDVAIGGSGADVYWIDKGQGERSIVITYDAEDKIYWNGYQLTGGGVETYIEWEKHANGDFWGTRGRLGPHGEIYSWYTNDNQLRIWLPDDTTISIDNFVNDTMGIHLEGPQTTFVLFDQDLDHKYPRGPIAEDGKIFNFSDLPGYTDALAHPGPAVLEQLWVV